jgi:hypothetical protein
VIEGLAIAALTVGATGAFLATKSSFTLEVGILRRVLAEMRAAGLAGDVPIRLVGGPDSYPSSSKRSSPASCGPSPRTSSPI